MYLAFRYITIEEKELQKDGFALGLVKSAETCRAIILLNGKVTTDGFVYEKIPSHRVTVLLHQNSRSCVQADADLEATLHPCIYDGHQVVPVTFSNLTTQTVSIAPRGILCEIQPVEVIDTFQYISEITETSPVLEDIFLKFTCQMI